MGYMNFTGSYWFKREMKITFQKIFRQDTLLPLRCILLQRKNPKKFAQLLQMESHAERRGEGTDIYKYLKNNTQN